MSLVYQHRRKDTGEIFYIGIGESKKRAYDKKGRNDIWKRIAQETKYDIEIIKDNITREEAKDIERMIPEGYKHLSPSQFMAMIYRKKEQ